MAVMDELQGSFVGSVALVHRLRMGSVDLYVCHIIEVPKTGGSSGVSTGPWLVGLERNRPSKRFRRAEYMM